MDNITRELSVKEYVMREETVFHAPYSPEIEFYENVMSGNMRKIEESLKEDFCDKKGLGVLSKDTLQSFRYHFVITTALLSRYCIEGGMEHEQAYTLSDLYIAAVDECKSLSDISKLHKKMVRDYTKRMQKIKRENVYSKQIVKCMNYIYDHLHERITLEDLAKNLGISESYLSRQFKKETGTTVSDYIMRKKIETARNMIEYSDYSLLEISNILAFPSQSYFTKVFRKYMGVTPGNYYFHLPSAMDCSTQSLSESIDTDILSSSF